MTFDAWHQEPQHDPSEVQRNCEPAHTQASPGWYPTGVPNQLRYFDGLLGQNISIRMNSLRVIRIISERPVSYNLAL